MSEMALFPVETVVKADATLGGQANMPMVHCPICGYDYTSVVETRAVPGNDHYEAGWGGRGDLLVIAMVGECGHRFELCLGFHKGQTAFFVRV